ncbi:hypothetical protein BWD42_07380 [Sphingobacterium sp. CZ-UAM]|uniref:putative zinc-binding metallopeptidase n=1 Tax=Sphingobacterium sp. CZ-UAM TaxID=1933868 RepID=UPI000985750A|nr:putative zinc-binding metallopeptidase [Sphingobacterium sp. CZ-UAM]OOG19716.1 hypothetical protein BWD42_07380 [Sphingobacterium sp. CZ-UAM]
MKKTKLFFGVVTLMLAMAACTKKEAPLVAGGPNILYTLPQGSHDYDSIILAFQKKYHTYILYRFNMRDFDASPLKNGVKNAYLLGPADEAYVGKLLTFLQQHWFKYYPDSFLKENLPFKLLLTAEAKYTPKKDSICSACTIYNQITIGNASPQLDRMSTVEKKAFVNAIHKTFFQYMKNWNKLIFPEEFGKISNYEIKPDAKNYQALGYVTKSPGSIVEDAFQYILLITSTPKDQLDKGVLDPTIDSSGLIGKKYKLLTEYYKSKYQIDLQSIGNATTF